MVRDLIKCNTRQKQLFVLLTFMVCGVVVLYGLLMKETVHTIVFRRDLEQQMSALYADVGTLEAQYIAHVESITLEQAHLLGFVEKTHRVFLSREKDARSLTLHTEEH